MWLPAFENTVRIGGVDGEVYGYWIVFSFCGSSGYAGRREKKKARSMRTRTATTRGPVDPRFETDDQKQIHDFQYAIGMPHDDRASGWRLSQKFWMLHQ
jgi:hypothetical protein